MTQSVFFGTDEFSVIVLNELMEAGLTPSLIVTAPDTEKGRGRTLSSPPVKEWALAHHVPFCQPRSLKEIPAELSEQRWELGLVASYGKIIPQAVLDLFTHGVLNVHPSLLPKHRGPSPIETSILEGDTETGVSIMLVDAEVDHGPILAQEKVTLSPDSYYPDLAVTLGSCGGALLARCIPQWIEGRISAKEQDHTQATFTKKIESGDGLIKLSDDIHTNYRKIRAFLPWPKAYYMHPSSRGGLRVAITRAHIENQQLILDRVIPAGKREMSYQEFLRGIH